MTPIATAFIKSVFSFTLDSHSLITFFMLPIQRDQQYRPLFSGKMNACPICSFPSISIIALCGFLFATKQWKTKRARAHSRTYKSIAIYLIWWDFGFGELISFEYSESIQSIEQTNGKTNESHAICNSPYFFSISFCSNDRILCGCGYFVRSFIYSFRNLCVRFCGKVSIVGKTFKSFFSSDCDKGTVFLSRGSSTLFEMEKDRQQERVRERKSRQKTPSTEW